jgi:E3 ubiquitin-protein ligase UHRF1
MADYEAQRQANIERNQKLLESLGLADSFFPPKAKSKKKTVEKPAKKRKSIAVQDDGTPIPSAHKVARTDTSDTAGSGARRSARNIGKTVDYNSEQLRAAPVPASVQSGIRKVDNSGPMGSEGGKRKHDP